MAALRVARDSKPTAVVFIVCDTGEHYLAGHHRRVDEGETSARAAEISAGPISGTKGNGAPRVLSGSPAPRGVKGQMNEMGLTRVPVLEDGRPVGSLREIALARGSGTVNCWIACKRGYGGEFPNSRCGCQLKRVTRRLQTVRQYWWKVWTHQGYITRHDVLVK